MSRVIVSTGKLAKRPYRMAKIERNIYSIEELCYSLVQSAQFLDTGIMDPELVRWIDTELGLPKLADKLKGYLGKERALSEFVSCILDYCGYVTENRKLQTRQIVASGQGMEPYERRCRHAAATASAGHSYAAIAEYEEILKDLPEPERELRADIEKNLGLIYADLFRFRQAADHFKESFSISGQAKTYLNYLAAVRMSLSDEEYLSFITEHPESYNASLELEKRIRQANTLYDTSEEKERINRLRRYESEGQETNYEILLHQTMQKMKDDYRLSKAPQI